MVFWHCTSYVPVISAKDMGWTWLSQLHDLQHDVVELGPPPHGRRMPNILIPAQLRKETADSQGLLLGTMLL